LISEIKKTVLKDYNPQSDPGELVTTDRSQNYHSSIKYKTNSVLSTVFSFAEQFYEEYCQLPCASITQKRDKNLEQHITLQQLFVQGVKGFLICMLIMKAMITNPDLIKLF